MIEVHFTDGTIRWVSTPELADKIVGKDADGDLLVPLMPEVSDYYVPLTPCCNASGKGGESGIVCRRCFRPVDWKYGGQEDIAVRVTLMTIDDDPSEHCCYTHWITEGAQHNADCPKGN